jgi:hypothetical protein
VIDKRDLQRVVASLLGSFAWAILCGMIYYLPGEEAGAHKVWASLIGFACYIFYIGCMMDPNVGTTPPGTNSKGPS